MRYPRMSESMTELSPFLTTGCCSTCPAPVSAPTFDPASPLSVPPELEAIIYRHEFAEPEFDKIDNNLFFSS
ncbi:hypothetical protein WR25_05375 [Diploscapter pachys]|uniref:Uncharacterized protein n=1 Tax=Diploscapter pachys TaxID=2018661 RepID=A0A2A2KA00_9BILA|nr:hypothetical protein WR25_05375 [Diploscapter pachys]